MIILLAALLVVGLLVFRQLNMGSSTNAETHVEKIGQNIGNHPPKFPVKPQDVEAFGDQMNQYIKEAESERKKQIEQQQQ